MISLGLLVVVVVIVIVVVMTRRRSGTTSTAASPATEISATTSPASIPVSTVAGVPPATVGPGAGDGVSPAMVPSAGGRVPVLAEALGYLGGVLALVGAVIAVVQYWSEMTTPVRLALTVAAAVAAIIAGALLPAASDDMAVATVRLRWFLWAVGLAAAGAAGGVFVHDVIDPRPDIEPWTAFGVAVPIAVVGAVLWAGRARPLQQAMTLLASGLALWKVLEVSVSSPWSGLVTWALGGILIGVGVSERIRVPWVFVACGALTAFIGAVTTSASSEAWVLSLLSVLLVAVLVLAEWERVRQRSALALTLVIVAGLVGLNTVPMSLAYFASLNGYATGAVVWVGGLGLVVIGLATRLPTRFLIGLAGAAAMLIAAVTVSADSVAVATLAGLVTAAGLVTVGAITDRIWYAVIGSLGLLGFVPWTIGHFFPGEGRVPLLIVVTGILIVAIAVVLARTGSRLRRGSSAPS